MTSGNWQLLGFDARESPHDCRKTALPEVVREVMLLRTEIECPFSVDQHTWPSYFEYYAIGGVSNGQREPPGIAVDSDCEGGLWLNLERMCKRIAESKLEAILIAVEVLIPRDATMNEVLALFASPPPDPMFRPEGSLTLGFDVADSGFWSGLSNCGYTNEDREILRPKWRGKINDYGLIKSEEDAVEFRVLTDTRVPEHAPFCVYRLSQLPEV